MAVAAPVAERYPRVTEAFERRLAEARRKVAGLAVELVPEPGAGRPCCRQFARCWDTKPIRIGFAPKLEQAPDARIDGILMHEFGHAADYHLGLIGDADEGAERLADGLARWLFGVTIRYDAEDVQTTGPGVTPRPARLGV